MFHFLFINKPWIWVGHDHHFWYFKVLTTKSESVEKYTLFHDQGMASPFYFFLFFFCFFALITRELAIELVKAGSSKCFHKCIALRSPGSNLKINKQCHRYPQLPINPFWKSKKKKKNKNKIIFHLACLALNIHL